MVSHPKLVGYAPTLYIHTYILIGIHSSSYNEFHSTRRVEQISPC
jgi:hypothetical protein